MRSPGLIHTPPIQYIIIIEYENLRVTPHLYRNAESQTACGESGFTEDVNNCFLSNISDKLKGIFSK